MKRDITPSKERLVAVRCLLADADLDGLLVLCPENRCYLSGFTAKDSHVNESSGCLFITQESAYLLTDFRYRDWATAEAPHFEVQLYPKGLAKLLPELLQRHGLKRSGFEAAYLTYASYQRIAQETEAAGLQAVWEPVEHMVERLRAVKDQEEIDLIKKSLAITEKVMAEVGAGLRPGLSEQEVAWMIETALKAAGAEGPSFAPMVASGPNSARPHHHPGERRLKNGEPIILDLGAISGGYCSDMTRTFILGEPDERFKEIYTVVRRAQQQAEAGIRAGMKTDAADGLAREVIEAAGYREAFGHSLGHGVGLAVHENPSLSPVAERAVELQAGMVTTVEPGIYLPEWGGVRLENMILIQENGAQILNQSLQFYEFE
ncbi:MAG: aminopeptidase P family protein [Deltaproteobacteria bacterium]|nr:aminopeptidase P family protein [Deltaproteobacteria bacterium]